MTHGAINSYIYRYMALLSNGHVGFFKFFISRAFRTVRHYLYYPVKIIYITVVCYGTSCLNVLLIESLVSSVQHK